MTQRRDFLKQASLLAAGTVAVGQALEAQAAPAQAPAQAPADTSSSPASIGEVPKPDA